jgi:intracellular multiplication protein IcmK
MFAFPAASQDAPDPLADFTQAAQSVAARDDKAAQEDLKNAAFSAALDSALPLGPAQIRELIRRMSEVQRAAAPPIGDPERPTPKLKVESVSLSPGSTPPVVKVSSGYVTTLMITDSTGAPWPVSDIAFAGKFDVKVTDKSPHIIRVTPLLRFQEGNISMQLVGLDAPVTLRIVSGTDEIYYRYDLRVPGMGPNAAALSFASSSGVTAGNASLMSVLDGYPPNGSRRMKVSGADDRTAAWGYEGNVYLRTPLSLLSPAWSNSVTSGDGTNVYLVPETPVLLLSDQGVMVRVRLEKPEGVAKGDLLDDN